ncbi:MAG: pnpA [Pseudomonas sp.]|nr:pnpA [Pseudomonas sp.]
METVDGVVVVGGGSVGLMTALKLGRAGVRVVVLEAESGITSVQQVVAYMPTTVAALNELGLLPDIRKHAVMCPDVAYRRGNGQLIAKMDWDVLAEDTDYPYMLLLGQNHVSSLLVQHLRALPNVDIRWNHRVDDLEQDDAYVTLQISSPGGPTQLRSRWVAATDGAQSAVREKVSPEFNGTNWPERMVAVNVFYDVSLHGYARANFIHDPVDWAFIVQLDQTGLWRVCYEEKRSLSDAQVLQRVPARLQRLLPGAPSPDQYRVEHVAPYQVSQRCVSALRRGRVILAGDAAHTTNPMGGFGLSGGVLEAVHLGDALIAVIHGTASDSVLDEYSDHRTKAFQDFTSSTSTAFFVWMKERGAVQRARDLAMLKKAGTNRSVMRQFLLDFEKMNGRRSRSVSSSISLMTCALKQQLNSLLKGLAPSRFLPLRSPRLLRKRLTGSISLE